MALIKNTSQTPLVIAKVVIGPGRTEEVSQSALEKFGATAAGKFYLENNLKVISSGKTVEAEFEEVDTDEPLTAFENMQAEANGGELPAEESDDDSDEEEETEEADPEAERLALLETARGLGINTPDNTGVKKLNEKIEAKLAETAK